jgi:hypothetical protein
MYNTHILLIMPVQTRSQSAKLLPEFKSYFEEQLPEIFRIYVPKPAKDDKFWRCLATTTRIADLQNFHALLSQKKLSQYDTNNYFWVLQIMNQQAFDEPTENKEARVHASILFYEAFHVIQYAESRNFDAFISPKMVNMMMVKTVKLLTQLNKSRKIPITLDEMVRTHLKALVMDCRFTYGLRLKKQK